MEFSKNAMDVKPSSTLLITAKAKEMKASGIDIVGFGAGEPDFDTPEFIKQAAIHAIHEGFTKYTPSSGIIELRKAICNKLQKDNGLSYQPSQIVVSNGAKHSLSNIFLAVLNDLDEVLIPVPFWLSYPAMVRIAGGVPVIVETRADNNFAPTKEALEKAFTHKTKAIVINSPSNPTGTVYTKEDLQVIADFAVSKDILVISDEIYEKYLYDGAVHISIASLNSEIFKRTIVVNGLSKSHSMTGWRIGYTACVKEIAGIMDNIQSHMASNPNSIAQKAALAAFNADNSCVETMRLEFEKRRAYIYQRALNIKGLRPFQPKGAFYLFVDISPLNGKSINGKTIRSAGDFAGLLLDIEKVAVVSCDDFGVENYIRLSYATSMEAIQKGLDRIEAFVNKLA